MTDKLKVGDDYFIKCEFFKSEDKEFSAFIASLPEKHWAKYDLSAMRLGWEACKTVALQSLQGEQKKLQRRIHNQRVALRENWMIVEMRTKYYCGKLRPLRSMWWEHVKKKNAQLRSMDTELSGLKHDNARYIQMNTDLLGELEQVRGNICPICDEGKLTEKIDEGLYSSLCDNCQSEVTTPDQSKRNQVKVLRERLKQARGELDEAVDMELFKFIEQTLHYAGSATCHLEDANSKQFYNQANEALNKWTAFLSKHKVEK